MPSARFDEDRDYGFADQVLALRRRTGLRQRELAALLGVSHKAIGAWEGGTSYPAPEHLQQLIALALDRGAFTAGRDDVEAAALWETVRTRAPRRTPPFDTAWFASLRPAGRSGVLDAPSLPIPGRHDWGEAPDVPELHGRSQELATLTRWVADERRRVVAVLGGGGVGKTALVARLAQKLAPTFPVVYWRSLRNALPVEEWLAGTITALSAAQTLPPEGLEARLALVLDRLQTQRALLVLDNLETILEPEEPVVRYRPGYEGYGEVLHRLATSAHQGCLVLTSREQPLRADDVAARSLLLGGLAVEDGRALLRRQDLVGDAVSWVVLVECYAGNPLALSVVGETITKVFGGDIAAFLAQGATVFGGIRQLLDEQITRLSPVEYAVLLWLAIEREPVGFSELVSALGPGVARGDVVEAVEALQRRSLLETGGQGAFTLQPVVLEYATTRLVEQVGGEVTADGPALLVSHALVKAQAKDYVRRSQERLIGQPLLAQLRARLGGAEAVERRLLALLEAWRGRGGEEQGYGPGNVVNLLRLLRGNLQGLDLSHLFIRQAYLQGEDAQDSDLADSHLAECALAEAFDSCLCVTFSSDGRYLVAGTFSGEVCMWRVSDRTRIGATRGHTGPVQGIDSAREGHLFASGGLEGAVRLWEITQGLLGSQVLATYEGHTGSVSRVFLSADGRLVVSGSQDGTAKLWDTRTGRLLHTLRGHGGVVFGVSVSNDGILVVSTSSDGTVKLWDTANGSLLVTLQGHVGGAYAVAMSPDAHLVISGGQDSTIRLWDVTTGRLVSTLEGHTKQIWNVALSTDGRLLVSGSQDGSVRLWDISQSAVGGTCLTAFDAHAGAIYDVALSPDARTLATASQDGTIRLWEVPSGKPVTTLQGYARGTWGLAWGNAGRLLASGTQDGAVNLWDIAQGGVGGTLRGVFPGCIGIVYGTALSEDGELLVTGSQDNTMRFWRVADGEWFETVQAHAGGVYSLVLSPDARLLITSGHDGLIKLWDLSHGIPGGEPLTTIHAHTDLIWSIASCGQVQVLASASQDRTIKLWQIPSGQLHATMRDHDDLFWSVAVSRDGKLVATGGQSGRVTLWEAPSGRLLATLGAHEGPVWGIALSPDSRFVASGGADGMVALWDVATRRRIARCAGHVGPINDVAVSPDGSLIASSSQDGAIKLWDPGSGACHATLRPDRRYERMDITGLTGVSDVQKMVLKSLGAVERSS